MTLYIPSNPSLLISPNEVIEEPNLPFNPVPVIVALLLNEVP